MNEINSTLRKLGKLKQAACAVKAAIVIFIILAVVCGIVLNFYSTDMNRHLSENLVRLHVVANSNSPGDQSLKWDVRDAVLAYMRRELAGSGNAGQARTVIKRDLVKISEIAEDVVKAHGMNYNVRATLGTYPFPTKYYGNIALPAGNYQALRLVIGNGEGANWWCVLFPPLCFVDVTHGMVPETAKNELKNALTEEEYAILTSADEDADIPIKIKFKIVELFENSKVKLAGTLNKIFRNPG